MLDYLKQNSKIKSSDLMNIYIYFKFRAYLQTTLTQTKKAYCIKIWKASERLSYMSPSDLYEQFESIGVIDVNDLRYDIKQAMKQLKPAQAKIINLYFYCGKTDLEISSMLQVTRQAVNNMKRGALFKLKKILKEYG
jgi:DNA-directed RNA polymerase specialized sigma subunit